MFFDEKYKNLKINIPKIDDIYFFDESLKIKYSIEKKIAEHIFLVRENTKFIFYKPKEKFIIKVYKKEKHNDGISYNYIEKHKQICRLCPEIVPYIYEVIDLDKNGEIKNDVILLIMEAFNNTLEQYLDNDELDLKKKIEIYIKLFHAVIHLHYSNVFHGDIKPDNICLDFNNEGELVIKFIDFDYSYIYDKEINFLNTKSYYSSPYYNIKQNEVAKRNSMIKQDMYSLLKIFEKISNGHNNEDIYILPEIPLLQEIIKDIHILYNNTDIYGDFLYKQLEDIKKK